MEEVTWLEVLSRQRDVVSRQRVTANIITVGRAYDNDIVFNDPHMAANHVRFAREDDGTWFVEDLDSINGIRVDGVRHNRLTLDDDTILQVGQTDMRVRTSAYVVAAEIPLTDAHSRWPAAIMSLALVCALAWLHRWLGETGKPRLIDYLGMLLACTVMAAAWAAVWSALSRIFTGTARYSLHLLIIGMGLALFALYIQVSEIAAFALSWTALITHIYIVGWLALAVVCFLHLRALGRVQMSLKAVSVMVLATSGITMQGLQQSENRASSRQAATLQRLEPPGLRIMHAQSETAFFAGAERLRNILDKARARASVGGAGGTTE